MSLEPDPRLRRLIARKGIDRSILASGIGPEDVYQAWYDGHASSEDAIERIRKLVAEGHDEGRCVRRIEADDRGG